MNVTQQNTAMKEAYHARGIKGRGIVFAVIDTGVNGGRGNIPGNAVEKAELYPHWDERGHGTMVASVLLDWCPDAKILSYNVFDGMASLDRVTQCLEDVLARAKTDTSNQYVVNISASGSTSPMGIQRLANAIQLLNVAGVPVVVAAGNDGKEDLGKYPSCLEPPICVAALANDGSKAGFSTYHNEVDFADIGVDVPAYGLDGVLTKASGTSFACPTVAGKIGLLLCQERVSEAKLYEKLKGMCIDLAGSGFDPYTGYGLVDLSKAEGTPKEEPKEEETDVSRILKLIPKPRMQGEDVREAQALLIKHGYDIEADGIFGPATHAAVIEFQQNKGLDADGKIGPLTWAALRGPAEPLPVPDKPTDLALGLVRHCREHLGDGYVWGASGQTNITESWIRRMDDAGDPERSIRFFQKQKAAGVTDMAAFDCSGLISRYLQDKGIVTSKRNCNHLWRMCRAVKKTELIPGDLVFRGKPGDMYHVGIYMGKGRVIEAKGRDDGVILRGIDASGTGYWDYFGRLEV